MAEKEQKKEKPAKKEDDNFRGVLRIAGREINGHLSVEASLRRIRGIGHNLAHLMAVRLQEKGIPNVEIGRLSEKQTDFIEECIKSPSEALGIRKFMLNRPASPESGKEDHKIMSDLKFANEQDVKKLKEQKTWVGWRHSLGQKVRGQHTRSTGRTGTTVGVIKKKQQPQTKKPAGGAGAPAKK